MSLSRGNRRIFPRSSDWTDRIRQLRLGVARSAARAARRRTVTMTRNKKRQTSGVGVSTQHDSRLIYRKRRMGGRRRRRWKRFVNRVHAVSEKDLGSQQVVFNKTNTVTNNLFYNQVCGTVCLYGMSSSSPVCGENDMSKVADLLYSNAADTAPTGLDVDGSSKFLFQSAVLDVTIRNDSRNNGLSDSRARMEVDVYELVVNTEATSGVDFNNILDLFSTNSTLMMLGGIAPSVGVAKIAYFLRGVTPFELSYPLSKFRIKIYKKTKYQLANGDQVTYQLRDPRRHSLVCDSMRIFSGFNKPGLTKILFIVGKLAPGLQVGPVGTEGLYQEQLQIAATRKYMFKLENYTEDRVYYENY